MASPNIELLMAIAHAVGPLCEQVVFVGGCATGLLITQPLVVDARATEDVDAIVEVASLVGYHALTGQLAERGFKQTMADNTPPFRWFWQRMQLDLVPLDEKVLGFAPTGGTSPGLKLRCGPRCHRVWHCAICLRHTSWPPSWRPSRTGATMTSI